MYKLCIVTQKTREKMINDDPKRTRTNRPWEWLKNEEKNNKKY